MSLDNSLQPGIKIDREKRKVAFPPDDWPNGSWTKPCKIKLDPTGVCDVTGKTELCVVTEGAPNGFSSLSFSLDFIIKLAKELGLMDQVNQGSQGSQEDPVLSEDL